MRFGRARSWAKAGANSVLAKAGVELTRLDPGVVARARPGEQQPVGVPAEAVSYLQADNPRLELLQDAYSHLSSPASVPTQWNDRFLHRNLALQMFRGDNAYVWQQRKFSGSYRLRLYLTLLDIESRDELGLLFSLTEDELFGALIEVFGERRPVSRDLLDSVNEINYLQSQTGLMSKPSLKVLDIGAGYGRMAHRVSAVAEDLSAYDCTDGVAVSTFLCEFYTRFRDVSDAVRVVPLHELESTLADGYDLAMNIHSFSECSHAASKWWIDRVAEREVEWFLIIPNTAGELLSMEADGSQEDFLPDVLAAGYELIDQRPVHGVDELRELIGVDDMFFLFRRSAR